MLYSFKHSYIEPFGLDDATNKNCAMEYFLDWKQLFCVPYVHACIHNFKSKKGDPEDEICLGRLGIKQKNTLLHSFADMQKTHNTQA